MIFLVPWVLFKKLYIWPSIGCCHWRGWESWEERSQVTGKERETSSIRGAHFRGCTAIMFQLF
jgi:hypothetical protein